jgi:hypothetical protein
MLVVLKLLVNLVALCCVFHGYFAIFIIYSACMPIILDSVITTV